MSKLLEFPISDRISPSDETDLRLYFETGGLAVFQTSTFGSQLDRARMFSATTTPCLKCGGDPERDMLGTGFVQSDEYKQKRKETTTDAADKWLAKNAPDVPDVGDLTCKGCNGFGFTTQPVTSKKGRPTGPITAKPTGSSRHGNGVDSVNVADISVAALGRVTRILDRVFAVDPMCAEALGAYYSSKAGVAGVTPFTVAAKKLFRKNPLNVPVQQLLVNIREEQRQKPDPNTGALLKAADEQAADLYKEACKAWNRAKIQKSSL